MSNILSGAGALTARKEKSVKTNKALNRVLETLTICGHLKNLVKTTSTRGSSANDGHLLRSEFTVVKLEKGDSQTVDLQLTLWNDTKSYVFDDGWKWNIG